LAASLPSTCLSNTPVHSGKATHSLKGTHSRERKHSKKRTHSRERTHSSTCHSTRHSTSHSTSHTASARAPVWREARNSKAEMAGRRPPPHVCRFKTGPASVCSSSVNLVLHPNCMLCTIVFVVSWNSIVGIVSLFIRRSHYFKSSYETIPFQAHKYWERKTAAQNASTSVASKPTARQ
jgi:hypothetical protein